jgi:hypothetical protein
MDEGKHQKLAGGGDGQTNLHHHLAPILNGGGVNFLVALDVEGLLREMTL